jgi:hypothetical protein
MACDINKNVLINKVKEVTKIIGKKNYSDASVQILKNNINVVFKKVSNNSEPYRASVTLKHMINGIYGNIITEAPISNNLSKNVSLNIPLNDKTIGIVSSSKSVNTPTEKVLKKYSKRFS